MKRNWNPPELERTWSVSREELALVMEYRPIRRLAVVVMQKFLQYTGRFPRQHREVAQQVVTFIASQLSVSPVIFPDYKLDSRSADGDRNEIRARLGWRGPKQEDADELAAWLRRNAFVDEISTERLEEAALTWLRDRKIEQMAEGHLRRLVAGAVRAHEAKLYERIANALSKQARESIDGLLVTRSGPPESPLDSDLVDLNDLKADAGRLGVESILREIAKLRRINEVGLEEGVFANVPPKAFESLRRRVATDHASRLRERSRVTRWAQLAVYCWARRRAVIDGLVELLIQIIHKISKRAEARVEAELLADFKRVRGKVPILAKLVRVSLDRPSGVIRDEIYPEVGLDTLRALAAEFRFSGHSYREMVRTNVLSSYSKHFRRILPLILDNLTFRTSNPKCQPVIDALEFLRTQRGQQTRFFPPHVSPPQEGVIPPKWEDALIEQDTTGRDRIVRITYEIGVLQSLRDGLRSKTIWVEGADRYRNPDEDLPQDFDIKTNAYYELLSLPRDPDNFIDSVRRRMTDGLLRLDCGMRNNRDVRILERKQNEGHISVTPLTPQEEPENLSALKDEISRRWPHTNLLDVLKETELRLDLSDLFETAASMERIPRLVLRRRLLLCLYALGTNTGLRRVLNADESESYGELNYTKKRFIDKTALRNAISRVADATFSIRRAEIWGEGTTACGSDSKKFGSWDQNLMTEWHIRYGGRGVMIYWHVDRKSVCIYSQLKRCSSSEVAAMMEGVLRHCTSMQVEKNYVDSHGQSEVGFAFSELLRFNLMPRLKAIHAQMLHVVEAGDVKRYSNLRQILTRPIQWDVIRNQYNEMVRYTTALRLGSADSESILRRFTRTGIQHPTYAALCELGKAVKTAFLCDYLHSEPLRREIHEGLNVVENWNSTNSFIFFGKGGEVATNRIEEQEISLLSLHLLQLSLVYVNTLMIQNVLREQAWWRRMGHRELRALTPLIYSHVNPYGRFDLDLNHRLAI